MSKSTIVTHSHLLSDDFSGVAAADKEQHGHGKASIRALRVLRTELRRTHSARLSLFSRKMNNRKHNGIMTTMK